MRPPSLPSAESPVLEPAPPPSLAALRAELCAQTEATAERTRLMWAASITACAVRSFWGSRAPRNVPLRPVPESIPTLPGPVAEVAARIGTVVAALPTAEAAFHLGLLYTALLPAQWRSRHGIFYTPPALADRLLDQAEAAGLDWTRAQLLDPAAGAGAFLVPATARMLRALGDCEPALAVQNISARIRGYELHGFAAWLAHVFIEAEALPVIAAAGRRPTKLIDVRDSLKGVGSTGAFDLVIGNPPFGRVSLAREDRERFARSLYGHANLYGLFMDLAVQLTRPGGIVSFLTPSSFLAGEYFKNLRALLWREAPPVALDFVTLRKGVFEDVLQETLLATYRKDGSRSRANVSFLHPEPGSSPTPESAGYFTLPRKATAPWVLPRHGDEAELAKRLRAMPDRFADWGYKISTGPLVWNRHKPQLRDKPGQGTIPLVWAECVTSDGRFLFRSQKRNHKPYFRLAQGDEWLVVRAPCVLLQRTTAKEQARRLIAAELPASFLRKHPAITVENHLNMLIPTSTRPAASAKLLAAFLNTVAADRAFRCLSGSVAVSAYELENLPVPAAADLKRLLQRCRRQGTIEEICRRLYSEDSEA